MAGQKASGSIGHLARASHISVGKVALHAVIKSARKPPAPLHNSAGFETKAAKKRGVAWTPRQVSPFRLTYIHRSSFYACGLNAFRGGLTRPVTG